MTCHTITNQHAITCHYHTIPWTLITCQGRTITNHTRTFQNMFQPPSDQPPSDHSPSRPTLFLQSIKFNYKRIYQVFHNIFYIVISHPVEVTWPRSEKYIKRPLCRSETSVQDFGSGFGCSRSWVWGALYHRLAWEESRTNLCSTVDYGTRCLILYTLSTGPFWCHKLSKVPKSESRYFYPSPFYLVMVGAWPLQ